MTKRSLAPAWGRLPTLAMVVLCATSATSYAQPKGKNGAPPKTEKTADSGKPDKAEKPKVTEKGEGKSKNFDFTGIDLNGRMRTPQLLYFLERANEELERASLEKRSFIPHMVRSVDEEQL